MTGPSTANSNIAQVYLQSMQASVAVDTTLDENPGLADEYIFTNDSGNLKVTRHTTGVPTDVFETFGPTELPYSVLSLGQGDSVKIDFSNGLDPLANTTLVVNDIPEGNNVIRVIGKPTADSITVFDDHIIANGQTVQSNGRAVLRGRRRWR